MQRGNAAVGAVIALAALGVFLAVVVVKWGAFLGPDATGVVIKLAFGFILAAIGIIGVALGGWAWIPGGGLFAVGVVLLWRAYVAVEAALRAAGLPI